MGLSHFFEAAPCIFRQVYEISKNVNNRRSIDDRMIK